MIEKCRVFREFVKEVIEEMPCGKKCSEQILEKNLVTKIEVDNDKDAANYIKGGFKERS